MSASPGNLTAPPVPPRVPRWRLAVLVVVLAFFSWNIAWLLYSAVSKTPLRVWGAPEEWGGILVLGPGGRGAEAGLPGTPRWMGVFAFSATPLVAVALGALLRRWRRRRATPPAAAAPRKVTWKAGICAAVLALIGASNVLWCLASLLTGRPLAIMGDSRHSSGLLAWGFGRQGDFTARAGDAVWWMTLAFGLILLALSLLPLCIGRRLAATHTPEERRAALYLGQAPQRAEYAPERQAQFPLLFAATAARARRMTVALVISGFVGMSASIGLLLKEVQPPSLAFAPMGVGAALQITALVYSLLQPRCPGCHRAVGLIGGYTECPHCAAALAAPGGAGSKQ
jgi:hypothetical protein